MITHIVSDMGGVLIALEWVERIGALLGRDVCLDELHRLWIDAQSTVDFESGRTTFDEFTVAFIEEFQLTTEPEAVQQEFLAFVQAPFPSCDTVLHALKPHFHLSLLSNTNPAHHRKLKDEYAFFEAFDQLFLSYQMGLMKPDPAIFQAVLAQLNVAPAAVAFFDDSARNVAAAKETGMHAYQVYSPEELMTVVQTFKR